MCMFSAGPPCVVAPAVATRGASARYVAAGKRMGGRKRRKNPAVDAGKAGAGAPASFLDGTAYRRAEKAYRRYTHDGAPETNFDEVIDCRDLENNTEPNKRRLRQLAAATAGSGLVFYALDGCPGLYLAPRALTESEQCELVHSAATSYQQPPNATNLAGSAQKRDPKSAMLKARAETKPEAQPVLQPQPESEPAMEVLTLDRLSRLRWATLGYQYQWTSRTYEPGKVTEMPARLHGLCSAIAGASGHPMEPQAAIVNYYSPKSTMGGHVDDAELDLSLPLVSLSLGLSAVFLFGGRTREEVPTAIWLRSGDAIIVTGEARLCYHGVPRIVEGSCPDFLLDPRRYSELSATRQGAADAGESVRADQVGKRAPAGDGAAGSVVSEEDEATQTALVDYMSSARININVRQLANVENPEQLAQLIAERSTQDTDQTAMSSVLGSQSTRQASPMASREDEAVLSAAPASATAASSKE